MRVNLINSMEMSNVAFVSSFTGRPVQTPQRKAVCGLSPVRKMQASPERQHVIMNKSSNIPQNQRASNHNSGENSRPIIGIIGKATKSNTKATETVDSGSGRGIMGMKASAYWESIGVLPLAFAGFGISALAIKMLKVKGGQMRGGQAGVNKVILPKSVITSQEEEAELHVFKCGGCGYEMYPARGREFKFFPDSFKCPLCGTPKSEFWDLNDPDDPRNQESPDDYEDEDEEEEEESTALGEDTGLKDQEIRSQEDPQNKGAGQTSRDHAETDSSST